MKKYLLKVGIFLLLIIVFDVLWGQVLVYMVNHAKGGDNWRSNYICNEAHEDILIFGSSRAIRHYNPIILTDSLGMSCYNCGQDANGAILNYARYQLICRRYHPKILIYDVNPTYDFLEGDNHHSYEWLRAYYDREGIQEIFNSIDDMEKYKMMSRMYRYNSKFMRIITDYIHPRQDVGIKGFHPSNKEMDTMKINRRDAKKKQKQPVYDSLKMGYFKKLVEMSEYTKIVFAVSPYWDGADTIPFQPAKEICQERNIPFFDFSNNPKYIHHNEYFEDGIHLNARGADEFTRDFVHELKKRGIAQ